MRRRGGLSASSYATWRKSSTNRQNTAQPAAYINRNGTGIGSSNDSSFKVVMDDQETAEMAKKARALKEKVRQTGDQSRRSLHGSYGSVSSRPVASMRPSKTLSAFGLMEDDDLEGMSTTVVDTDVGSTSDLSFDSLRGLSKHLKGGTDTQEELAEMYGRMKFKSRQDRQSSMSNNVHSMNSNGRARTAFSRDAGNINGMNNSTDIYDQVKDDEFGRPRSNMKGMMRKRAGVGGVETNTNDVDNHHPSYPISFEKEGVIGIERWMDDLKSEIAGEQAQIRSIEGEVQRLHMAFVENSAKEVGKGKDLNLNTILEAFEKLQTLHKMLTCLQNESNLKLNEPIANELSLEFKQLTFDYNLTTHGLTPLPRAQEYIEEDCPDDFITRLKDWNSLIGIADKYKMTPIKVINGNGEQQDMIEGEMITKSGNSTVGEKEEEEESSKSDVSL